MPKFEEIDFSESDPRQYSASSEGKNGALGVAGLILVGLAILMVWLVWGHLKQIGAIPQTRIVDVHVGGDWLTGESRTCRSDGLADVLFCPKQSDSHQMITAGGPAPQSFSVSFYGYISGKPDDTLNWNCRRESESIICHPV